MMKPEMTSNLKLKRFLDDAQRICSGFKNQTLHRSDRTLNSLSQNANIKVCRFGEGKGTALLDADTYRSKLNAITQMINQKCIKTATH